MNAWSKEEGTMECPHCKSVYKVTITRFPCRDSDHQTCEVCDGRISWNDTRSPSNFRLLKKGVNMPKDD